MSESTSKDEYIKVVSFNGKKRDWSPWEEIFLARAMRKGYKLVLTGKETIPESTEVLDESKDADKHKIKIRELNQLAYSDLVTAMDTTKPGGLVAFSLIKGSKTVNYKDGMLRWHGRAYNISMPLKQSNKGAVLWGKTQEESRPRCVYHVPGRPSNADGRNGINDDG
jgi:hypothetical protein